LDLKLELEIEEFWVEMGKQKYYNNVTQLVIFAVASGQHSLDCSCNCVTFQAYQKLKKVSSYFNKGFKLLSGDSIQYNNGQSCLTEVG